MKITQVALYILLTILVIVAVTPLFWQISSSLRLETEYYQDPTLFPRHWTLVNYRNAFKETSVLVYFLNSLKVTVLTTFFTILISSLGAYSLSRFRYPGKRILMSVMAVVYMFPPILFLVPVFLVISFLGLLDTHSGLILSYTTGSIPFSLLLLVAFFETIPREIDESGLIDGAPQYTVYARLILPLSLPGIATVSIFSSISTWNEFLLALVFINSGVKRTISAGLFLQMSQEMVDWGMMMALATIVQIPMLIFFVVYGRGLVRGLTAGAVKG